MIRSEEELAIRTETGQAGRVRLRKSIKERTAAQSVDLRREHVVLERQPAERDDDGAVRTLDDGSLSIPVWREELVVERRWVVGERVIARKRTETVPEQVLAPLRYELVDVDADPAVARRVHSDGARRQRRGPRLRAR